MICAACACLTTHAPCAHCGGNPLLDGRFSLLREARTDLRGTLYDGLDGEIPVRLRLSPGPEDDASIAWGDAAERWLKSPLPGAATPIAWGELQDGRWYRAEASVAGAALRRGGSEASVLGVVEALLSGIAALHAAGITHGGLTAHSVVRSEDQGLILIDFGPDPGTAADDVAAVARIAGALAPDPFDASINAALRGMSAADPAARPSASDALRALRDARRWRRAPTQPVEPPRTSVVPLFVVLLLVAGVWFWTQRDDEVGFWQGELTGEVWRTTGDAPTASGETCRVSVAASDQARNNCQVQVRCGETLIYGDAERGYARCVGSPVHAHDKLPSEKDSDPRLDLVVARGRLVISDERHGEWSVTIGLKVDATEE